MSGKGIPETRCAREKSRVEMNGTIGKSLTEQGCCLAVSLVAQAGSDEGRNFSGASTVKVARK